MTADRLWSGFRERFGTALSLSTHKREDSFGFLDRECRHVFEPTVWFAEDTAIWPYVYIKTAAHTKMWFWTHRCPVEVQWLLECQLLEFNNRLIVVVHDAHLPYQDVSRFAARTSAGQRKQLIDELRRRENRVSPANLFGAGHSHHTMPVYQSHTDHGELSQAMTRVRSHCLRLVAGKSNHLTCAIGIKETGMVFDHVDFYLEPVNMMEIASESFEALYTERVNVMDDEVYMKRFPDPPWRTEYDPTFRDGT